MAILDELFGITPEQAQGVTPDFDSPYLREALLKAFQAHGIDVGKIMGNTVSRPEKVAEAPKESEVVPPRPVVGQPYTPPPAQPPTPPLNSSNAPPPRVEEPAALPPALAPMSAAERFQALARGYDKGGLVGGIADMMGAGTDRALATQNYTYQALAKMIGPEKAAIAISNPDVMKAMAPVLFGSKQAEWKEVGTDKYGQKIYGWVNPGTQEVKIPGLGGQPGAPATTPNGKDLSGLTGKELLDALDPGDRAQVVGILEGRQAPPSPNARNARTQRIMEWVAQAEPGFDMTTWKARNQARTEMSSTKPGTAGFAIQSLETAMNHIDSLQKRAEALDNLNVPGGALAREYIVNPIARNMSGLSDFDAREGAFNAAKKAVLDEASKVFVGGVGAWADRKAWEEKLNAADSPAKQKQVMQELVTLMKGRLEAIANSRNRALGEDKSAYDLISPATATKIKRIIGEEDATAEQPPAAAPQVTEGTVIQDKGGRRMVFRGGQWRPM